MYDVIFHQRQLFSRSAFISRATSRICLVIFTPRPSLSYTYIVQELNHSRLFYQYSERFAQSRCKWETRANHTINPAHSVKRCALYSSDAKSMQQGSGTWCARGSAGGTYLAASRTQRDWRGSFLTIAMGACGRISMPMDPSAPRSRRR